MRAALLALLAACGGAPDPEPAAVARAASPIATSAGSADAIVAQVNGRPVWASCVAAQGAKLRGDARAALDECIAFELLAQEAEKRGLLADRDVVAATRTALVNRLVELGFEQRYQKPSDLGERLAKWQRDNAFRMHRPELRASAYARVPLAEDAPPADAARAKAAADALYARLARETGLFAVDFEAIAKATASGLEIAVVGDKAREQLDASYATALWDIPEVGRVSAPVRTPWGWDIVLWTGGLPAQELTPDQMAALAFPELRRSMFAIWVSQIARDLGVKPVIDPTGLEQLAEVGP